MNELSKYPFLRVNVPAMAQGIIDLFTEEERTILRFGMLPAEKMDCLKKNLESHFRAKLFIPNGDEFEATVIESNGIEEGIFHDYGKFSLKQIISDVLHAVTLEIYKRGNLVV